MRTRRFFGTLGSAMLCAALGFAVGSCKGGSGEGDGTGVDGGGGSGADGGTSLTDARVDSNGQGGGGGFITIPDGGDPQEDAMDLDAACAAQQVAGEFTASNMLFIIDKSGSMKCNPPPTMESKDCEAKPQKKDLNVDSKWQITKDGLKQALLKLGGMSPLPSAGIGFFNSGLLCGFADEPDVLIGPLDSGQISNISQALDDVEPWGGTPIVGAMMRSYAYLHKNAASFKGNKFVVLLTDGGESCDENAVPMLISKAAEAKAVGIRTFVLGAPGSENYKGVLSQIAFNGGTPSNPSCDHSGADNAVGDCHMDMTLPGLDFAEELSKNLEAISSKALSCEFDVPTSDDDGKVVDKNKVNVVYTPSEGEQQQIKRNTELDCDDMKNNGWQYSADGKQIRLCGQICETVKADRQGKVTILLGCATQEEGPK